MNTNNKTPLVLAPPNPPSVDQAAMRTIAAHAQSATELRELLMMTGLIPSPERPETEGPREWHPECLGCGIGMFKRDHEPIEGMRRHGGKGRCTACAIKAYREQKAAS